MEKDYNEILCEAIDVIVKNRLSAVSFDKSIVCTIVDDSEKTKGHYIVTDGTIKFDAYTESEKYKINDQVYVTIPQGDYSQQKIIVSKYTADNSAEPITYVSPLETMVTMTDSLASNVKESILANGEITSKLIWQYNLRESGKSEVLNNKIYTTLGMRAKFKCLLEDKDVRQGHYGLQLDLVSESSENSRGWTVSTVFFDSAEDMFGNPYAFTTFFSQEKKVDISNVNSIIGMNLYLYQKKDFKYFDGIHQDLVDVPTTFKMGETEYPLADNIFVSDIYIALGDDVTTIEDNTFKIYTNDSLDYSQTTLNDPRTIYSIWYNKDEFNQFIGFGDGVPDDNYDENTYQDEYETLMKGATLGESVEEDIPRIKEALQIYANAEDLNNILDAISSQIDVTFNQMIITLKEQMLGYSISVNSQSVDSARENLSAALAAASILSTDADESTVPIITWYKDWLKQYYNDVYRMLLADKNNTVYAIPVPSEIDELYNNCVNAWNFLLAAANELYEKTLLQDTVAAYPITQTYLDKAHEDYIKLCNNIKKNFDSLKTLKTAQNTQCTALEERLISDKDITLFEEEYQKFIDDNANKYCIYWYRYNFGYSNEEERYMPVNWEKMPYPTDEYGDPILPKPGMPIDYGKLYYHPTSDVGYENILLNPNVEEEKFKAILFYNHVPYHSNELIFNNTDGVLDPSMEDIVNALSIELGDKAQDTFQLYGQHNMLINSADAAVTRKIRVRYNGAEDKDDALVNCWVYWYIPEVSTMLTYNTTTLYQNKFIELDESDEKLVDHWQHAKPGYKCFFKKINGVANYEDSYDLVVEDTYFYFTIKNYYVPSAMNNDILCRVVKESKNYEAEKHFSFCTFSTSGTDYTLSVLPTTAQTALINVGDVEYPLEIAAKLYDFNNILIENSSTLISWKWMTPNKGLIIDPIPGKEYERHIKGTLSPTECLYNVLECGANWNKINEDTEADQTLVLKAYYPVPYSSGYYYIEGPSTVVYDSLGANPSYYKGAYKIYNVSDNQEVTEDIVWKMKYYDAYGNSTTASNQLQYLPSIVYNDEKKVTQDGYKPGYYLHVKNMYVTGINIYPVVVCEKDGEMIWAQPILIMQNQYGSPMLNSWDEGLTIDEENGTILSTMMGAGYKDNENRFFGVIMGEVETTLEDAAVRETGLYGFHEGVQSFGFKVGGTAFIGKSGGGRLEFDGNYGIIKSGNWDGSYLAGAFKTPGTKGTAIDLQQGRIDAHNFSLTSGFLTISSDGNPYFEINPKNDDGYAVYPNPIIKIDKNDISINSTDGQLTLTTHGTNNKDKAFLRISTDSQYNPDGEDVNNLFCISKSALYMQTPDYKAAVYNEDNDETIAQGEGARLQFNGVGGFILEAYNNFTLEAHNPYSDDKFIKMTTKGNTPFQVGNNFILDWRGNVTIRGGSITIGTIDKTEDGSEIYTVDRFKVDSNGDVTINGGSISIGTFTTTDSEGNIKVTPKFGVTSDGVVTINGGSISIYNNGSLAFGVTSTGALTATNANIMGTITASAGAIGNWTINSDGTMTNGIVTLGAKDSPIKTNSGFNFSIDPSNGQFKTTSSVLESLTVTSSLVVNAAAAPGGEGGEPATASDDGISLAAEVPSEGAGSVTNALATINGTTYIDGNTEINGTLRINADTSITTAGNLDIAGSLTVNGAKTFASEEPVTLTLDRPYEAGVKLTIQNGIITAYEEMTEAGTAWDWLTGLLGNKPVEGTTFGALAYLDEVVISSSTFKLGDDKAVSINPVISGNVATFTVTIPGDKKTLEGGTTDGHYVKVYANKALPSGYSIGGYEDKGDDWVQVGKVWASGEEYDGGTLTIPDRKAILTIAVTAQKKK